MTLVKRNGSLLNPLPVLFDDFLSRDLSSWRGTNFSDTNTTIPAANIRETAENFEVELAVPGMAKEDFRVELDGNVLTVTSEKTREEDDAERRYTRREFSYQSFRRTFNLHKDVVDTAGIQARYEDGVLRLVIPKKEEARQRPPRQIQIL